MKTREEIKQEAVGEIQQVQERILHILEDLDDGEDTDMTLERLDEIIETLETLEDDLRQASYHDASIVAAAIENIYKGYDELVDGNDGSEQIYFGYDKLAEVEARLS